MQDIQIQENQFNLKDFLKSFIKTWQKFWDREDCMEVFMGIDAEAAFIYLHEEDIYEDHKINKVNIKKLVDVVTERVKEEGYAICFPFTTVFMDVQENGHLTCADGKEYKLKLIEDEDGGNKFEDPNAPDFYDLGCYGIMLRWEDGKWVCCGGLRHSADDSVEYWKQTWEEIDVPMEKFLRKFIRQNDVK